MRLFKYACPKGQNCIFSFDGVMKADNGELVGWHDTQCLNCGMGAKAAETIWDKIQYAYWTVVPWRYRPKHLWYAFGAKFWHRYTTVKPRKLDHSWCDRSHLLFHMVFEIGCEFLEKEGPKTAQEWLEEAELNPERFQDLREMAAIREWWLNQYNEDYVYELTDEQFDAEYPWETNPEHPGSRDDQRRMQRYYAECKYDEMVLQKAKRVIDLSPHFWS